MVREGLKLLFLIVAYNFLLHYISGFLPIDLFPTEHEDLFLLLSLTSGLYFTWLFGFRERTVLMLAYVFLFQVLGLSVVRSSYEVILQLLPSILLTLSLIWLFESPVEKRTKKLEEDRKRLEEDLRKNEKEMEGLLEQINLSRELVERIEKEKEYVEQELRKLREEEIQRRKLLEQEKEALINRLSENQKRLQDYVERLQRLTSVNRELFEMLEALQDIEPKGTKDELSKLRQERKRLSREILNLQELLEELSAENIQLSQKQDELRALLQREREEKELLQLRLSNMRAAHQKALTVYMEVLDAVLTEVEFDERAVEEFMDLQKGAKVDFLKELMLLNMKDLEDRFERMRGYKNIFKLKPPGGRIYFTFGEKKKWKVVGMLWGEDEKVKSRYARELLLKYKD